MFKILSLLLLSVFIVYASATQAEKITYEIQGTVLEKGTRQPLSSVQVYLVDDDTHVSMTDAQGHFVLTVNAPGDFSVGAVGIGFVKPMPRKVTLSADRPRAKLNFYLEPAMQLPDVVVYADRDPDKISKRTFSGKTLREVAGSGGDPIRGLQAMPGVAVTNDSNASPAVRGTAPGDNLYYVDSLPVGYLFHFGGIFSILNADLVDDFNFYPSAFGPEFGDVLGAVIDVRLRDPRTDRLGAKVNINFYESDFLLEGPLSANQSLYFAARRSYYDLLLPKTGTLNKDEKIEYRSFPRFYDYQGKHLWRPDENNSFRLQFTGASDKSELSIPTDSTIALHDPALAGTASNDVRFDSLGWLWDHRLSPQSNNKFSLGTLNTSISQRVGSAGTILAKFNDLLFRNDFSTQLRPDHLLSLGGNYTHTIVDYNLDVRDPRCTEFNPDCDSTSAERVQSKDRLRRNDVGLYIKDRWRIVEPLTLVIGARAQYENYLDETFTEPRLGVEWQAAPRTLLAAGWGKYHQFPDGSQVIDQFGNPNLSNLRGRHAVLGVKQTYDQGWSLSSDFYYKTLEDLVVSDDVFQYLNTGEGQAYGLELLLKKDLTQRFSGWIATSLSRSERTNNVTGETFRSNYDQPVIVNLVASYKINKDWTFGAKWRYNSGSPYTPIVGSVLRPGTTDQYLPVYGQINAERLPGYHRLDLRLGRDYRFNTWKLNTYVELINAYNNKNIGDYRYNNDYTAREPVYQLPLIFSFGLQGEF